MAGDRSISGGEPAKRESRGVMTYCGKIRSQVIGYCVLCTGGTLGAEKDKTLITNLKFPQFTSELERAGTIRNMARQQVLVLKVMHMYT